MKLIFFGTPEFVIPVLETLLKHHDVITVVTAPDHLDNKKQQMLPSPIKSFYQHYYETHADLHERHPLQILTPDTLDEHFAKQLSLMQPELFIVAAYGKIIPKTILNIPPFGALNVHPSLLPKYRGTSPVPAAILNGDNVTGVSIIKMDEKMDHGPILASESETILETDTFETLVKRLFEKSAAMLPNVIENYTNGNIPLFPQDEIQATYVKMIQKNDGFIDLENLKVGIGPPAGGLKLEIKRKIRAYHPWPGVWTKWKMENGKWKIIKFLPGEKVQMEGKKPMSIKDFLNGYPELKDKILHLF